MAASAASLREYLTRFDGRAFTILGEAEAAFSQQDGYYAALIPLAREAEGQVAAGATWLIKSALESGAQWPPDLTAQLWDTLDHLPTWAAQLHICQSVRFLTTAPDDAPVVARWLKVMTMHQRPFVRAWALDGLAHVARQHGGTGFFADEFAAALARAVNDKSASVRARARKVRS